MSESDGESSSSITGTYISEDPGDTGLLFQGGPKVAVPLLSNRPKRATQIKNTTQAELSFSQVYF